MFDKFEQRAWTKNSFFFFFFLLLPLSSNTLKRSLYAYLSGLLRRWQWKLGNRVSNFSEFQIAWKLLLVLIYIYIHTHIYIYITIRLRTYWSITYCPDMAIFVHILHTVAGRSPRGVMASTRVRAPVEPLGKVVNLVISPSYWLNRITTVLLQGWHWITHEGWYAIKQKNQPTICTGFEAGNQPYN